MGMLGLLQLVEGKQPLGVDVDPARDADRLEGVEGDPDGTHGEQAVRLLPVDAVGQAERRRL